MGKKGIAVLLFILISGLGILIYYIKKGNESVYSDPYMAVPDDASLIIESVNLPELMNEFAGGNGLFKELASVKELGDFFTKVKYLANLFNRKECGKLFENNKSLISFHSISTGKIVPLLLLNVPSDLGLNSVRGIVDSSFSSNFEEIQFGRHRIVEFFYKSKTSQDTVFLTKVSGLFACSPSFELINKAIKQTGNDKHIRITPGFSRIMSAAGKKEDKIFIIFSNLPKLIISLTGERAPQLSSKIARIADSAEGDIFINENGIILSGYSDSNDSTDYLYKYKSILPGHLDTYKVLPSSTVLFETMLLTEKALMPSKNPELSDSTVSLARKLKPYIGEEVTRALIDIKDNPPGLNSIVVYELRNRDIAERVINESLGSWAALNRLKEKDYIQNFQPDEQTKIAVFSTPFKMLSSVYFKRLSASEDDSLVTFYDNYMIWGNSYKTISRFLYDNILNKTLFNDAIYRDFETSLPSRATYYFYCVPSGIVNYLSAYLSDTIITSLYSNILSLRKIQAVGFQFAPSNKMIYNTLSVKFKERGREETGTEWETLLDTAACIKPFFFTNHNTGAREIFIQDFKNNCYLINSAGRVLWKISLNERILGNVFMIDYYGNKKYQLLFSGKNYLHLVDRNGNYVERYPVKLRSPASAQLALFDYDNNNDYRLLIPGEDRLIYAYDKSGSVVKGWKPFRTNGIVKSELKFFRASGKDYIVASDENTVYFLDRTGAIRLKPKEPVERALHSEIRMNQGSDPSLVFTAPDGKVQVVSFDGDVRKTLLQKFSPDHSFDFFDVDGDGFGEYIFIDHGILYLYDHDKSELFKRDFGSDEMIGPITFIFSATDRKIGLFDNTKKLIYLIDNKGNTINGFPLRGESLFSIGKISEKSGYHLIVGGSDSFLYNYKIETENK
jgi:hypothetical protein